MSDRGMPTDLRDIHTHDDVVVSVTLLALVANLAEVMDFKKDQEPDYMTMLGSALMVADAFKEDEKRLGHWTDRVTAHAS